MSGDGASAGTVGDASPAESTYGIWAYDQRDPVLCKSSTGPYRNTWNDPVPDMAYDVDRLVELVNGAGTRRLWTDLTPYFAPVARTPTAR